MRKSLILVTQLSLGASLLFAARSDAGSKEDFLPPVNERYAEATMEETPSFQKHVVPLFGRLGCNGRACHGSFQGRGGFRLSLFGYDFKTDHDALHDAETPRVNIEDADESLIVAKPTDADYHEGGLRYELGSWQHHVIRRWIEGGAKFSRDDQKMLVRLEVSPSEIQFNNHQGRQEVQLRAVAVWEDGTREDVTPLCRFDSNDDVIAEIDDTGMVHGGDQGDTHVVISYDKAVVPVPVIRPTSDLVGAKYPEVSTPTTVDALVVDKLRKLGIVPSDNCTDADFLRRVRLDMTGTLPSPNEVESFLSDDDPDKRSRKVDELLETPAYAAWWTTKLCDFTGNNTDQLNNASPMRGSASREWYEWIHKRVAENVPYDELVAGIVTANSMRSGQEYIDYCKEMSDIYRDDEKSYSDLPSMTYFWSRQDFQNNIEARAIGFAYSFMGLRIQCAQCHKHPFDQWSKDDFHQFKNFFAKVVPGRGNAAPREHRKIYNEIVEELGLKGKRGNEIRRELPKLLKEGKTIPFPVTYVADRIQRTRNPDGDYPEFDNAKLLGGDVVDLDSNDDPRTKLMEWLRGPENRFFARAFVNRVWASYFNVGIVEPPDDLNLANPPSNGPLLDYLAKGFIDSGFDMKWVHRTIANSATYQRSWKPNDTNGLDERNFSRAVPRRLPAEVAYDAIQQATSSDDTIAAMHQSNDGRAIAVPGSSNRRTNNDQGFALAVFGRSTRESNCDCDRSSEPSLLQTVFLQNDNSMLKLIDVRKGGWLDQVADELQPKKAAENPQLEKRLSQMRKQIDNLEAKRKKLAKGKDSRAGAQASRRIEQLRKQVASLERQTSRPIGTDIHPQEISDAITQAYLRSLCRYPTEDELARSQEHVGQSESPVDGIRDVLWALLNTKEFIVNH